MPLRGESRLRGRSLTKLPPPGLVSRGSATTRVRTGDLDPEEMVVWYYKRTMGACGTLLAMSRKRGTLAKKETFRARVRALAKKKRKKRERDLVS